MVLGIIGLCFNLIGAVLSIILLCIHDPGFAPIKGFIIGSLVLNLVSLVLPFILGRDG